MLVKESGNVRFDIGAEKAREFISDIGAVASCIPDSRDFKKIDDKHFTIVTELGIGVVRGSFPLGGALTIKGKDEFMYGVSGKGLGSEIKMELLLRISETDGHAELHWEANAELKGIMSGVAAPIIKSVTEKKIKEIIANAKRNIVK